MPGTINERINSINELTGFGVLYITAGMETVLVRATWVTLGVMLMSTFLVAHHGDAGRYEDTLTTVSGRIVEIQLVNPHSSILIEVAGENGRPTIWRGELGPPTALRGWCWGEDVIKAGDEITMTGRRLKNGQPSMTLSEQARVIGANGQEIFRGNEPGEDDEPGPCAQ